MSELFKTYVYWIFGNSILNLLWQYNLVYKRNKGYKITRLKVCVSTALDIAEHNGITYVVYYAKALTKLYTELRIMFTKEIDVKQLH